MTAIATSIQLRDQNPTAHLESEAPSIAAARSTGPSRRAIWAGRILSGLASLFLAFDSIIKVLELPPAMEGSAQLGYPTSVIRGIGIVGVVCLVTYLVRRTSVLGAVLWTGYLGGAVATHVRVGNPLFSHTLFPIYVAALLWAGLWLRDRRVRAMLASSPSVA